MVAAPWPLVEVISGRQKSLTNQERASEIKLDEAETKFAQTSADFFGAVRLRFAPLLLLLLLLAADWRCYDQTTSQTKGALGI